MKVSELIEKLSEMEQDREVLVWLPGSYITLHNAFDGIFPKENKPVVLIEGNLTPGSALERE